MLKGVKGVGNQVWNKNKSPRLRRGPWWWESKKGASRVDKRRETFIGKTLRVEM